MAAEAAEDTRARLVELFPEGFEEAIGPVAVEFAAYTDADGEERLRAVFGTVESAPVAAGWEDGWRAFHRPVRIGPLWVGPPWELAPADALAVVVDPGRAFGTGAHPTTRLTLELLLEVAPGSLVDVGCGSGVLALAAAKLGFAPVHAYDLDPAAVEATEHNAAANEVSVRTALADALTAELPAADVAVANIALDVVEAVAARLEALAIVASGYLDSQLPRVSGLEHVDRRTGDGWAADLFRAK